jgi:hypothetical protein
VGRSPAWIDLLCAKRKGRARRPRADAESAGEISFFLFSEYQAEPEKLPTFLGGFGGEVVCFVGAFL